MPLQCLGVGDIMGRARGPLGVGDDLDVTVAPLGPLGPVVSSVTPKPTTPWWVWLALLYVLSKRRR